MTETTQPVSTHNLIGKNISQTELEAFHNEEIKTIKLSDYKDRWIALIFYPADFTFVCPTELEDAAELYPEFQKAGAEIMSISTDTVYVHKAWHDSSEAIKKIKYPMLSDPTGRFCKELNVYITEEGLALRGSFIISPEGVIKAYEVHDNNIGRSAQELLRKLQSAVFVSENPGQVCPARWKPGEKTLKPGLDLVGKI
ncbi:redoxin domain-containing protein [Patescibacteria group bacterium]|nr:redoxin domain-containing protein [Patescibacteria group bacterium]MBU1890582.1 redoxin domain-containing protein [Patescibacteria group bacterium]